jgi:diamine N-acetyltransferase
MNEAFHWRYATESDAEILSKLGRQAFLEAFETDNTPENMALYLDGAFSEAKQRKELLIQDSVFLIAELDGVPAGYARLLAQKSRPVLQVYSQ